jgi:hypothetical protein
MVEAQPIMATSTTTYASAASTFIQRIRDTNLAAADCLDQIWASFGDQAAYYVAFALIVLKERQVRYRTPLSIRDLYHFTAYEELRSSAQGVQLYKDAARHYLIDIIDTEDDTQPMR